MMCEKSFTQIIQKYEEEYDNLWQENEALRKECETLKQQHGTSSLHDVNNAKEIIKKIVTKHGQEFVLEMINGKNPKYRKQDKIRDHYNKLVKANPSKKSKELRERTARYFGITDKAVQKHIYKK